NPLAGQGVNIGFLDAAALAQVLVEACRRDEDIGGLKVLKQYEKMRRMDNLLMMTTMDAFYRIFSNSHFPVKLLRNMGLGLAERFSPAKNKVMRYAMGLDGNLPKLARGDTILD
ncbi:MAG: 2-octaprenyl-3-methyl-6-methoxy-1,4-benzoquinol hydroxylase, partial [Pseudomonadota bacterium]